MSFLPVHVVFPASVHAKQTILHKLPVNGPLRKCRISRSGFWVERDKFW